MFKYIVLECACVCLRVCFKCVCLRVYICECICLSVCLFWSV